jgi:hypothetical protein
VYGSGVAAVAATDVQSPDASNRLHLLMNLPDINDIAPLVQLTTVGVSTYAVWSMLPAEVMSDADVGRRTSASADGPK